MGQCPKIEYNDYRNLILKSQALIWEKSEKMSYEYQPIQIHNGQLIVPDQITLPIISGDGIGPEVSNAMKLVVNKAVEKSYQSRKSITWLEVLAGQASFEKTGEWLPQETLDVFSKYLIGIKGP